MSRRRSAARLLIVRRLLEERAISSQEELVRLLAEQGHAVTQATVSRDLQSLGATKIIDAEARERYTLPAEAEGDADSLERELVRRMGQFVVDIDASGNLVVIKTPPGSAGAVAAALDAVGRADVLGTLCGDDTIMVVARDAAGGPALAERLRSLMGS